MTENENSIKVLNCLVNKTFYANIDHPLFPISGSGIVSQHWCDQETSEFPDGYADLCTDPNRNKLFCHNIYCKHFFPEAELKVT